MANSIIKRQLQIDSRIEELKTCLKVCYEMRDLLSLDCDTYFSFQTSLLEAVENAIVHGNKFDDSKKVKIRLTVEDSIIEVLIEDEGNGFDPECIADPTCGDNLTKENGRGIFFIKNLCDDFQVIGKGNIVKLIIRI
jgi:serine/threonine-protein kinase RsbW